MPTKQTKKYPVKYLPKRFTQREKQVQATELRKSQRLYKQNKYHTRRTIKSYISKPSPHVQRAKTLYRVDKIGPTDELAKATGCTKEALDQIIAKGEGAYFSSGSRPNQTAQSWGIARLASAITAGKAAAVDYNILEKGCNPRGVAMKMAKKAKKQYGYGKHGVPKTSL